MCNEYTKKNFCVKINWSNVTIGFIILLMTHSLFASERQLITFIVNPISHELQGIDIDQIIRENLDFAKFEYKILTTQYPEHATTLAKNLLGTTDIIAVVGGDGTVNEVAAALLHTDTPLAIIPAGSGNGLARHLSIPTKIPLAIQILNQSKMVVIDAAKINDKTFFGIAGIGFDAYIAHRFAQCEKRGFLSYCKLVLEEFSGYREQNYRISIDGKIIEKKAFILSFANSSQYGNDFIIAPTAKIDDGYLNLIVVPHLPHYKILEFLFQCRRGTLNQNPYFESYPFQELLIETPMPYGHIDGEPLLLQNPLKVSIEPKSVKILVPAKTL